MPNRKRNIQLKFYVTEDERRLIDEKMALLPTQRIGAYLRKMAIDGYIIYTDTRDIKEIRAMHLHERRLDKEPCLAAAAAADHQDVFIAGILRHLRAAAHG